MAIHSSLPIYKETYRLLTLTTEFTRHMPRDFKGSLGKRIHDECVDLVVLIYTANAAVDKVPALAKLIERLQVVDLLLRLAKDLRLIGTGPYADAIEITAAVGKQATGWRKYSAKSPAA